MNDLRPHEQNRYRFVVENRRIFANPHALVDLGDFGYHKQVPIKGFRMAPTNPQKRVESPKRKKRK